MEKPVNPQPTTRTIGNREMANISEKNIWLSSANGQSENIHRNNIIFAQQIICKNIYSIYYIKNMYIIRIKITELKRVCT